MTSSTFARRKTKALRLLKSVFGFDGLRPFQETVVDALLNGRDVLAVSGTGSGKSLTFQLPSLVLPGVTIVVSPLLALMREQSDRMQALGVKATRLTSDAPRSEVRDALQNLKRYNLVYVSPEKAKTKEFRLAIQGVPIAAFCVDEAHIASRALDFRASYAALGDIFDAHEEAVRFACTATADSTVEIDVRRLCRLRSPVRVVSSPWRENIAWEFVHNAGELDLCRLVEKYQEKPGSQIVYTSSRKECEHISDCLQGMGLNAAYYHAGMEPTLRARTQQQFMEKSITCMAATSAFGMGVDAPDIRLVANWQMPASLFDLLQQVGRGSRDGAPALGWVNLGYKAERAQRFFIEMANPGFRVYDRLWKQFSKQEGSNKWSGQALLRVAGIKDNVWSGQLDAAMSYLEFTGHISTSPGGVSYHMPVRDPFRARNLCTIYGGYIKDDNVIYDVAPGAKDNSSAFYLNGSCVPARGLDCTIVRAKADSLTITADMIADKHDRAVQQLDQIEKFSTAKNRKKFVDAAFAKGD